MFLKINILLPNTCVWWIEKSRIFFLYFSCCIYLYGNGSDEMLPQETALGEVNIGYKVCDEASYTSGSVLPCKI